MPLYGGDAGDARRRVRPVFVGLTAVTFLIGAAVLFIERPRSSSGWEYMRPLVLAFGLLLFAVEGRSQAYYEWAGKGSWNGETYEGYSAYSSAEIAYFIASFGGPGNATLTDSDPGMCNEAPTGLDQVCDFSTSYFVQSSGATPTLPAYMRSFGYGYWLAAPAPSRAELCANNCVTIRSIPPWQSSLYPRSPSGRVPLRRGVVR